MKLSICDYGTTGLTTMSPLLRDHILNMVSALCEKLRGVGDQIESIDITPQLSGGTNVVPFKMKARIVLERVGDVNVTTKSITAVTKAVFGGSGFEAVANEFARQIMGHIPKQVRDSGEKPQLSVVA